MIIGLNICVISSSMLISLPWFSFNYWCGSQIVRQKLSPLKDKNLIDSLNPFPLVFVCTEITMLHFLNKLGPAWGWPWSRMSWSLTWMQARWRRGGAARAGLLRLSLSAFILSWSMETALPTTNTVSEQKIPITILILKWGPCLGQWDSPGE